MTGILTARTGTLTVTPAQTLVSGIPVSMVLEMPVNATLTTKCTTLSHRVAGLMTGFRQRIRSTSLLRVMEKEWSVFQFWMWAQSFALPMARL